MDFPRFTALPLALVVFLCGLITGTAVHWMLLPALVICSLSGRRLVTLSLLLFLASGLLAGRVERRAVHFLRNPPAGSVLLYGTVDQVDGRGVGLLLLGSRRNRIHVILPYGWPEHHLRPGDVLHLAAEWSTAQPARNPGSPEPVSRLRSKNYRTEASNVRILLREHTGRVSGFHLFRIKTMQRMVLRVNRVFSEPLIPWVRAMLLGDRTALPEADLMAFRRSGLAHLLAVSGLHVGILFGAVAWLTMSLVSRISRMRYRHQQWLVGGVLMGVGVSYGTLLGWPASATRALLMLLLAGLCRMAGRSGWLSRTWMLALFLFAFGQPERVVHDLGIQLSFAAVGGLIAVPLMTPRRLSGPMRILALSIVAGTAAFLSTAPLLLRAIGWVPVGAVVTSLAGIPLTTLFLLSAFLTLVIPAISGPLGALTEGTLQALLAWAHWSADSWHLVIRSDPPGWSIILLLLGLISWMSWPGISPYRRILGLVVVLLVSPLLPFRSGSTLTMLDVGQGEAMVLEWPGTWPIIVDTGPGPTSGTILARYLDWQGVREADLLLSHGDKDHTGGWERLAERMPIPTIRTAWEDESSDRLITLMGSRWVPESGARVLVLHPEQPGRDNIHSMVVLLVWPGLQILLTGDIDEATESLIISRWSRLWKGSRIRVLKVAHHGSRTSTGISMLTLFNPQIALYSAGRDNTFGHPHAEVLERLAASGSVVHGTLGNGALQLRWNRTQLSMHGWSDGRWRRIESTLHPAQTGVSVQ